MRKKRLNHFADAIIGILTGWRVLRDFNKFHENGSGLYELDLINRTLSFNSKPIEMFHTFSYIQKWYDCELSEQNDYQN